MDVGMLKRYIFMQSKHSNGLENCRVTYLFWKHRCQPSRNRAGNPAFSIISHIFARTSRISGLISKKQKLQ